mgnify:CR=1 FL=1
MKKNIDRRSFLRIGAITGLASGVSVPALAIQGNKIGPQAGSQQTGVRQYVPLGKTGLNISDISFGRSEEHTSELQSQAYLVCRLLLEKKK